MSTYTHAAPLARSNSFFGAIKNIVTAPFAWLAGSDDEFEDTKGKRRRLPVTSQDAHIEDATLPSKRMRVDSSDKVTQPYLDPPTSVFTQPRRASDHLTSNVVRDGTRSPRRTLHLPSSNQLPRNRRTVSPLPSRSTPSISDIRSEPNYAADSTSASGDLSTSPRRLRVRSSLTPQPSVTGFGPVVPPRRERGPDEPPPLTTLMSNPMFVKPPAQRQGPTDPQQPLTLGNLVDSQRSARAPPRQSSILFGTGSMTDVSAPGHLWPVNKAEVALHELEVYKTPLLPTRLKGATAVPDMFLHKGKKHITLMTDDRPVKPRLGTESKGKGKGKGKKKERERETTNGTKPYAGEGGMKKWLARRKKEEEEEMEKEKVEAMEDERAEEKTRKEAEAEKKKREEELKAPPPPPPVPVFEPMVSREGPLGSSLRVGRTRLTRNHIERPVSRRAKFSAAFEDEDEDMEERKALEEAAKKAPAFEPPTGFTFAKETTITHDLSRAKEPPITALPFSLGKPAPAPEPSTASVAAPVPVAATPAPVLPKISLVPPTPETTKVAPAPATSESALGSTPTPLSIPNLFPSSSVFAKPVAVTPPSSFLTVPTVEQQKPTEVAEPKVVGTTPPSDAPPQPKSVFAVPTSDSAATPSTLGLPPTAPKEAEKVTPAKALPFTFGPPVVPVEPVRASAPSQPSEQPPPAEPAKATPPSNGTPFTFGSPPSVPTPTPTAVSTTAAPATSVEPPKNIFTFSQPAPAATSTSASAPATALSTADTPKSIFGAAPPATPFSFGQGPTAKEKPATSPFAFGTGATEEKKSTSGFTFGAPIASTAPPAAPPTFTFGATPSGTTAADVSSKPFAFGTTTPARPATPPKAVQEVTMDESPTRDMVVNGNGKAPERPTLSFTFATPNGSAPFVPSPGTTTAPFSFGAPGAPVNPFAKEKKDTKPAVSFGGFGQAASSGFSFGQKPPESPATTAPPPAPFQFAQPSPTVAPVAPFSFGGGAASATPFGQSSAASAPSSPSFNRTGSFAFGTPSTTQPTANPFTFGTGSQPASPATGNTNLPSGTTGTAPFTFNAGAAAATTPAVSFGGGVNAAAPAGSLFTMGSAPAPAEGVGGRRIIKGLPRRGGRR